MDCVFCKIVNHEIPAEIELETDKIIAFKSIDPASAVHLLVVPKKHIDSFLSLASDDGNVLFEMAQVAQNLVRKHNSEGGYKLIFNGGKYQAIPHLHWHLLAGDLEKDYHKKT